MNEKIKKVKNIKEGRRVVIQLRSTGNPTCHLNYFPS
jgi:hypothetical protein